MRTTYCGLVSETLLGQTVTLMGWAHRRRDHGGVIFIDLRDREGLVQIVCDPDRAATFAVAEERAQRVLPEGDRPRAGAPAGHREPRPDQRQGRGALPRARGAQPERHRRRSSSTTRTCPRRPASRTACSTCAGPQMQRNLMLRYRVAMEVRKFLDANGFIDIETPMLTKSTPEGARDYLVPSRVHDGMFFALPQTPAALQAAADGRRLRPLLPDHEVLPRRGPARRPPARVHADRHRDLLPRPRTRSGRCSRA